MTAMFDSLLVPVDETPESERAVPIAAALARCTGAAIEFVTVDSPHVDLLPMRAYHEQLLSELPDGAGGSGTVVLDDRPVAEVIAELWAKRPGSLLVIASRTPGALRALVSPSIAGALVGSCDRPVLVVGDGCDPAYQPSRHTTVALEDPSVDQDTFEVAVNWAHATRSPLNAVQLATAPGRPARAAATEVLDVASADGGTLVVGARHRGRLDRLLHGSGVSWLVHRATTPVLVVGSDGVSTD
jgi:nucleotide-binding universal stress UspA family protein